MLLCTKKFNYGQQVAFEQDGTILWLSCYIFIVPLEIINYERPKVVVKLVTVFFFGLSWVQTCPTDGLFLNYF